MKKSIITLTVLALSVLSIQSCKKYGCTDVEALNHSNVANKDDGSCMYAIDEPQNVQIEYFSASFTSSSDWDYYFPSTTISDGDIVLVEVYVEDIGTDQYWAPLTYVDNNLSVWYDYDLDYGDLNLYTRRVDNGQPYPWSGTATFSFRMAVIKQNAIAVGTDFTTLKIDDFKSKL